MKFKLCHSCRYYHPSLKELQGNTKEHCTNPLVARFFGDHFPQGSDIYHCDMFTQGSPFLGDAVIFLDTTHSVSFFLTKDHVKDNRPISALPDNSINCLTKKLKYV